MNRADSMLRRGWLRSGWRLLILLGLASVTPSASVRACDQTLTCPAPDTVMAEPVSNETLRVRWRDVPTASYYNVYRQGADGAALLIVSASAGLYCFDDGPGLDGSSKYSYYVTACITDYQSGETYESDPSTSRFAFTYPNPPDPGPVQTVSNASLKLAWPAVAGASYYEIFRKELAQTSATFSQVGLTAKPSFEDAIGLKEVTCYQYKIRTRGATGISPFSEIVNGWTAPNPPTGLKVVADATSASCMVVTWVDRSLKENGFILERSATGSDPWRAFMLGGPKPGAGGTVTYRDNQDIEEGKQFWYRVRATYDAP